VNGKVKQKKGWTREKEKRKRKKKKERKFSQKRKGEGRREGDTHSVLRWLRCK
jgi:hypothetical protein